MTPSNDMNDKVKATIAALFTDYVSGNIQCLRVEYISTRGELCGLYTDRAMARSHDAVSNVAMITEELTETLKNCLLLEQQERGETVH